MFPPFFHHFSMVFPWFFNQPVQATPVASRKRKFSDDDDGDGEPVPSPVTPPEALAALERLEPAAKRAKRPRLGEVGG